MASQIVQGCSDLLRFTTFPNRGRAVVAARDIAPGTPLIDEEPLISMPLPESREDVAACERCCRPLGTVDTQFSHLVTDLPPLPSLPMDEDDATFADDVRCPHGRCGARFCSADCLKKHAASHGYLCGGRSTAAAKALERFEAHARATHETFMFGAKLVADAMARGGQQAYDDLCRIQWWEISDEGVSKSANDVKRAREDANCSRKLLLTLLSAAGAKPAQVEWLTLDAWGGLLGAARRNAICVQLAHPLGEFVPALSEWLDERASAKEAKALRPYLDALPAPLPDPLWTAVYPRISCLNHACKPNCEVRWLNEDHRGTVVATRAIAAGDELCITYIDDNERADYRKRRASLRDYGFECDCTKCESEASWARRLRPRLTCV